MREYTATIRNVVRDDGKLNVVVKNGQMTLAILSASTRAEAEGICEDIIRRLREYERSWPWMCL